MSHPSLRSISPSSPVSPSTRTPASHNGVAPPTTITPTNGKGLADSEPGAVIDKATSSTDSLEGGATSATVKRAGTAKQRGALPAHWIAIESSSQLVKGTADVSLASGSNDGQFLNNASTSQPANIDRGRLGGLRVLPPFISPVDSPADIPSTPNNLTYDRMAPIGNRQYDANAEAKGNKLGEERKDQKDQETLWSVPSNEPTDADGVTGRVEKSIAASLNNTETTARSRKTSHSLGLFKENIINLDHKKRDYKRDNLAKDKSFDAIDELGRSTFSPSSEDSPLVIRSSSSPHRKGTDKTESASANRSKDTQSKSSNQQLLPTQHKSSIRLTSDDCPEVPSSNPDLEDSTTSNQTLPSPRPVQDRLPSILLDEIRNGRSTLRALPEALQLATSCPTTKTEKSISRLESTDSRHVDDQPSREQSQESQPDHEEGDEDGDESEHDEITSALYIPHQTPALEPKQDPQTLPTTISTSSTGDEKDSLSNELTEPLPSPYEVDITLEQDGSESHLHGDGPSSKAISSESIERFIDDKSDTNDSSASESEYESLDELERLKRDETSLTDDAETTPTATPTAPAPIRRHKLRTPANSQAQETVPTPLNAVELKPYKHQVGGHTTVFRFSRRAVCKPLSNRENEFYETIESLHPELLTFLPRYIGVLNVTFRKALRKKKKKDKSKSGNGAEPKTEVPGERVLAESQNNQKSPSEKDELTSLNNIHSLDQPRLVSHSQLALPTPEVVFENNRHIIPYDLFGIPSPRPRSATRFSSLAERNTPIMDDPFAPHSSTTLHNAARSSFERHQYASWGATSVNQKLQAQVLREVFSSPTIHHHTKHKYTRSHISLPHSRTDVSEPEPVKLEPPASQLRRSSVDSGAATRFSGAFDTTPESSSRRADKVKSRSTESQRGSTESAEETSAVPSDEQAKTRSPSKRSSNSRKVRRRHSGMGLRRKRLTVDGQERGELQYYEDEGYGGDGEDGLFAMDDEPPNPDSSTLLSGKSGVQSASSPIEEAKSKVEDGIPLHRTFSDPIPDPAPLAVKGPSDLDIPANPTAAQSQSDQRVEHFLLLEDVTAGMRHPCVLDLKMGTRQYGLDANEKKQESQQRKGASTTSRKLGVRLCGMQVWDAKQQTYFYQDKYYGRGLKQGKEFQSALARFFYNGLVYDKLTTHIPVLLEQVKSLEAKIRSLRGYRFYASSLLILYDGDTEPNKPLSPLGRQHENALEVKPAKSPINIRIVDFANCVTAEDIIPDDTLCPPKDSNGIDKGFLRGLKSLKLYLKRILSDTSDLRARSNGAFDESQTPPQPLEPYTDPADVGFDSDVSI